MGRKRDRVSLRDVQRWLGQGFGSGEGAAYRPWLRISDVPSQGRSRRVRGFKTGRVHHLLSDLEYAIFLLAEYSQIVVDIREQYPLLPYARTEVIAAKAGIRHPVYPRSQTPIVVTHDFLLTLSDRAPDRTPVAISAKYMWDSKARTSRMLEKLEIERRFTAEVSRAHWSFVTDKDFHPAVIRSLDWLHYGIKRNLPSAYREVAPEVLGILRMLDYDRRPISEVMGDLGQLSAFRGLDPWIVFKVAAWQGHLPIDLKAELGPRHPVREQPPLTEALDVV